MSNVLLIPVTCSSLVSTEASLVPLVPGHPLLVSAEVCLAFSLELAPRAKVCFPQPSSDVAILTQKTANVCHTC